VKNYIIQFNLHEIDDIRTFKLFGIVPHGIKVIQNHKADIFLVEDSENWIRVASGVVSDKKINNYI
jgi:hypothetical protein